MRHGGGKAPDRRAARGHPTPLPNGRSLPGERRKTRRSLLLYLAFVFERRRFGFAFFRSCAYIVGVFLCAQAETAARDTGKAPNHLQNLSHRPNKSKHYPPQIVCNEFCFLDWHLKYFVAGRVLPQCFEPLRSLCVLRSLF